MIWKSTLKGGGFSINLRPVITLQKGLHHQENQIRQKLDHLLKT